MSTFDAVARDLVGHAAKVQTAAHAVVSHHGWLLLARVRRHAAQPRTHARPRGPVEEGPRLLTGSYNRGLNRRTFRTATASSVSVGTNDVRGAPLEFGNPDAFGRGIETLPYPHFGPGLEDVRGEYLAALAALPGTVARQDRTA